MKIIIFQAWGEPLICQIDIKGKVISIGESKTIAQSLKGFIDKEGEWSKSYYLILNKSNFNKLEKELFYHGTFILVGKTYLVRIDNCYIQDYGNLKEISIEEGNSVIGFDKGQYIYKIKKDKVDAYHYIEEYLKTKNEKLIFDISYIRPIKLDVDGIEDVFVNKTTIKRDVFPLDDFFYDLPLQHTKRLFFPWMDCKEDYNSMTKNILHYGKFGNV